MDASFSSFLRAEEKDKNGVIPQREAWPRCVYEGTLQKGTGDFPSVRCNLTVWRDEISLGGWGEGGEFCKEMAKFALKWEIIANSLENCEKCCTFVAVL